QFAVGAGDAVVAAEDVLVGDDDGLATGPHHGALGELAQADLGALQVGQDADRSVSGVRRLPYPAVTLLVLSVAAVTEVQPGHVHTGLDEVPDALRPVDRGTERTDDLRTTLHDATLDSGGTPPFGLSRSRC